MASRAMELLVKLIEGKKVRKKEILLPPKLMVRSSTAPPGR
jgi:DNA-binding LacI/PurR family transcriptional regulator